VLESIENATVVGTVTASDNDLGIDGEFTFSAIAESHPGYFAITQDGKLISLVTFDREVGIPLPCPRNQVPNHTPGSGLQARRAHCRIPAYFVNLPLLLQVEAFFTVTLKATDKGALPLSSTTTVIVKLLDVNDNPPIAIPDVYDDQVPEDAANGYVVATIHAIDKDIGENADLIFAITAGNSEHKFVIDEKTGVVTLDGALDAETIRLYVLTITVYAPFAGLWDSS